MIKITTTTSTQSETEFQSNSTINSSTTFRFIDNQIDPQVDRIDTRQWIIADVNFSLNVLNSILQADERLVFIQITCHQGRLTPDQITKPLRFDLSIDLLKLGRLSNFQLIDFEESDFDEISLSNFDLGDNEKAILRITFASIKVPPII